ncbi:TolC family protein [Chitinophaga defluvii]|uniref:TolC family protein n=1 Tax=Chitinophaga defluvii TaxID=3163343 RepID=A0ABV2TE88_9BACT
MKKVFFPVVVISMLFLTGSIYAQQSPDSLLSQATVEDCIRYALAHQPVLKQSQLDEEITERTIKSKLADWYPQVNLDYNIQHYLELPTSFFQNQPTKIGVTNSSAALFSLNQNLFSRDLLLASNTARDVRKQVRQNSTRNRIDVISDVSKGYYDVLLTKKQIEVLDEDVVRLERSLKDAYNQYQSGVVDKIDYKRATISLNNTRAQRKGAQEQLTAKIEYLKQLMGYPTGGSELSLVYDTTEVTSQLAADTAIMVDYKSRIEYQLLQTQQTLLKADLQYNKWSFLPSLSAFINYSFAYQHNEFAKLYDHNYPNSLLGLKLSLPIFQGSKRIHNIRQAELQLKRIDWDFITLKNQINTQYTAAMAVYRSNLNDYTVLKENLEVAKDVYNMVQLQYKAGVKTYLDVIISETDLRSAQLNYFNAMYQVLSSKIDLQKALGTLTANY